MVYKKAGKWEQQRDARTEERDERVVKWADPTVKTSDMRMENKWDAMWAYPKAEKSVDVMEPRTEELSAELMGMMWEVLRESQMGQLMVGRMVEKSAMSAVAWMAALMAQLKGRVVG